MIREIQSQAKLGGGGGIGREVSTHSMLCRKDRDPRKACLLMITPASAIDLISLICFVHKHAYVLINKCS